MNQNYNFDMEPDFNTWDWDNNIQEDLQGAAQEVEMYDINKKRKKKKSNVDLDDLSNAGSIGYEVDPNQASLLRMFYPKLHLDASSKGVGVLNLRPEDTRNIQYVKITNGLYKHLHARGKGIKNKDLIDAELYNSKEPENKPPIKPIKLYDTHWEREAVKENMITADEKKRMDLEFTNPVTNFEQVKPIFHTMEFSDYIWDKLLQPLDAKMYVSDIEHGELPSVCFISFNKKWERPTQAFSFPEYENPYLTILLLHPFFAYISAYNNMARSLKKVFRYIRKHSTSEEIIKSLRNKFLSRTGLKEIQQIANLTNKGFDQLLNTLYDNKTTQQVNAHKKVTNQYKAKLNDVVQIRKHVGKLPGRQKDNLQPFNETATYKDIAEFIDNDKN